MSTKSILSRRLALVATALFAAGGASVFGCSSSSNDHPTTPVITSDGGDTDGSNPGSGGGSNGGSGNGGANNGGSGNEAGGGSGNNGGSGNGGSGNTDGGDASPGAGGASPEASVCNDPLGPHDCYPCEPATTEQYLNHCPGNGVSCVPFDNAARLGAEWNGGNLPPLN